MLIMSITIIVLICCFCNESKKVRKLEEENKRLKQELSKYIPNQNSYTNPQNMQQGNMGYQQQSNMGYQQPNNIGYQQQNNMGYGQQYNMNQNMAYQNQPYNMQQVKVPTKEEIEKAKRESKNVGILVTGSIFIILAAIVFLASTWNILSDIVKTIVIFLLIGVFWGASSIAKNKFNLPKASKAFFYLAMAYIPIALISCSIFGLFGEYLSINGEGRFVYLTCAMILLAIIYIAFYKAKNDNILLCGSILSQITSILFFTLIFESDVLIVLISLLIYSCLLALCKNMLKAPKILYNFSIIISSTVSIIAIPFLFFTKGLMLILLPLLAINFMLLKKSKPRLFSYFINAVVYLFGIYLSLVYINISTDMKLLIGMLYSIIMYLLIEGIAFWAKDNDLSKSSLIMNALYIIILAIYSNIPKIQFMQPFILYGLETLILSIAYIRKNKIIKEGTNVYGYLIPCTIIMAVTQILEVLKADFYIYIIFALVFLKISDLKIYNESSSLKKGIFAISQIYIIILYMVGIIECESKLINLIIGFVVSGYLIFNNYRQKQNEILRIIPVIGFLTILTFNRFIENTIYFEILIILSTLILTALSVYKRKISIDTLYSTLFAITTVLLLENTFVKEGIFIAWSLINLIFMNERKDKDIFKTCLFIGIFALYNSLIDEFNVQYNSVRIIGITLLALALLKGVIKNYSNKSQDTFEYIVLFLIYAISLGMYINVVDGMIFVLFLVAILVLSYFKKYGAAFIATLTSIIVNAFVLTREFWFSIPWWIYLLVVGALLIAFAIKNESDEKKGKKKITSAIKDLKEKIEK